MAARPVVAQRLHYCPVSRQWSARWQVVATQAHTAPKVQSHDYLVGAKIPGNDKVAMTKFSSATA
jgi:hypothetical protein